MTDTIEKLEQDLMHDRVKLDEAQEKALALRKALWEAEDASSLAAQRVGQTMVALHQAREAAK